jgi:hypothetical protein
MTLIKNFIFSLITLGFVSCYAESSEILFKGKSAINYKDVCNGNGEKYKENDIDYKGQYICKPNFRSYAGVQLIVEKNDACDSAIEYDAETGWVIRMYLRYPEQASEDLLNVLSEKYGNTRNLLENFYVDEFLNFSYNWVDERAGSLSLKKEVVKNNNSIVRRCTTLRIHTRKMGDSSVILRDRYESNKRNRLKKEANRL